jgi:hypothetical protein
VKPATKRRRRQCRAVPGGDRRQVGQVEGETAHRLPIGRAVAWSGSRGAGNPRLPRGPCWQCSITGSSAGPSFSRSVKPATKRRRRQCRAVPGGDRRQVGQVEGETAHRLPIGVAVAGSGGCSARSPAVRQASVADVRQRLPPAWPVLAALDHRQFGRAFVLSIGEAGHEATTAPGSSGAWWRSPASGPGRRRDSAPAADRGCRGLGRQALGVRAIRGCRWRGPCWQRSIIGSSVGPSFSRSVKPATKRRRRQLARSSGAGWRSPASGPGRRRDSVPAADRSCRGLVRLSGCGQSAVAAGVARAGSARLDHRQFGRQVGGRGETAYFVLSIGEAGHEGDDGARVERCLVAIAGKWARSKARQRTGCRSVVPWPGQALGVRAIRGCRWRGPCWQRSITGSSVGPSSSRSVKPATKRRRRQCRAVPGGDRRQVGQGEGETAYRLPIGVPWPGQALGVLAGIGCMRQGCRWRGPCWQRSIIGSSVGLFVLSIGEAGHEATTAPGGDRRQVGQGEARQRTGCRSGLPWRGQALGVLAGIGCRRAPGLPPAWFVLAALDHRQFGRAFVLSIGEAGHEATTAPASSGAGWRSPASGARSNGGTAQRLPIGRAVAWSGSRGAGNPRLPLAWPVLAALDHRRFGRSFVLSIGEAGHEATTAPVSSGAWWRSPASGPGRTRDSIPAADRACRGLVRLSGCSQASVAGVRQGSVRLRRGPCWRCSIVGSSAGPSFSRSVKPATKRRRRQRRAVPGGDRRQVGQVERETAHRLPIGVAVAVVVVSGCWQSAVAAGVARAGSARPSAVRSGLRSLDR